MPLPGDYPERVYAGVLGKIIGVYLGRPVEGWSHERIVATVGAIWAYLHAHPALPAPRPPLVVTDDDITGTFTFLRAMADSGYPRELSPAMVAAAWLNYIVPLRTILWWGGLGNSTEHTAYLHLRRGVPAPESGSIARNGPVVAEQIGAQIFVDGWAMLCPGDPERAADLARRAASVSHDGEAIYGAQVIAAMEALAFVEPDLSRLYAAALACIPAGSLIARLIDDLRVWHAADGDWRRTRRRVVERYGYDRYGGNCHIVPNHALVHLALLYGGDDFQLAQMIVNTSGWDTDCNAANVGCLLGIKNGLAGLDAGPDWRGPVADRLYLPTADGGRAISDALTESFHVVNLGRALAGEPPLAPKGGARFHFSLPGSVQGWQAADPALLQLANIAAPGNSGERCLALRYGPLGHGLAAWAATATFIPPEAITMPGYQLLASPTLYPGQVVRARIVADAANPAPAHLTLAVQIYGPDDRLQPVGAPLRGTQSGLVLGPATTLAPGAEAVLRWPIPDTGGAPIASIGICITGRPGERGTLCLDWLGWDGAPRVTLGRPAAGGTMWRRAWVDAVDQWDPQWPEAYRLVQNEGLGLISQGTAEWRNYRAEATLTIHLARAAGLAVRVGGMRRCYALLLSRDGVARLVKWRDTPRVLAEAPLAWAFGEPYTLRLEVVGHELRASVEGHLTLAARDDDDPLTGGGVGLLCEEGRVGCDAVRVEPV